MERAIHEAARGSTDMVLGGDIFDFRWSRWSDRHRTIEESIRWLERLVGVNPACQIHYLLGNHDASPEFIAELSQLAEVTENLVWHPHLLRLHDCVFLHGDIIDAGIPLVEDFHHRLDELRRRKDRRTAPRKIQHSLYDAAVTTGVHRWVAQVANPKIRVLDRVSRYVDWAGYGPSSGIRNVYFGHTHRRLEDEQFAGMRFFNPGASIKGIDFRMLEIPPPAPQPANPMRSRRRERLE
jgi:UDP-2,3-diacylglucosamine hydrolase